MYKYDKIADKLTKNGKIVKNGDMLSIAHYIIAEISRGASLSFLPLDSEIIPPLYEILNYIETDAKLVEMHAKAEKNRLAMIKEKLIESTLTYQGDPTSENKDVVIALDKTFTALSKQMATSGNLVVNFHRILPDDFWEKDIEWEINKDGTVNKESIDA